MQEIVLPEDYNYISVFLTFDCPFHCAYCINKSHGKLVKNRTMSTEDWINGLNRIRTRDIPLTISGGEPTTYPGFYELIKGIRSETPIDLLTNLEFDIKYFTKQIPPERLRRNAPYANIRVSFHKGQSDFIELCDKVIRLRNLGYSIGVFEVDHPEYHEEVIQRQVIAQALNIDWRLKEFLGPWKGKIYGTFRYPNAVCNDTLRNCMCRTSELLIAPDGNIFRCHSDLYANRSSIGHILHDKVSNLGEWLPCSVYGKCNSCDLKVKNNRFQQWGHSSVEIKETQ